MSGVYWTLIVELVFYGLAFILFVGGSLQRPWVLAVVAAAAIASAVVPIVALRSGLNVPTSLLGYHLSFLILGSLIRLSLNDVRDAKMAALTLLALLAVTLPLVAGVFGQIGPVFSNATPIGAIASVAAAVLVFVIAWGERYQQQPRAMLAIGAWSYSLYLFHEPIASLVEMLVVPSTAENAILFFCIAAALSFGVARLVYRWVEEPAQRTGKKLSQGRDDRIAGAVA